MHLAPQLKIPGFAIVSLSVVRLVIHDVGDLDTPKHIQKGTAWNFFWGVNEPARWQYPPIFSITSFFPLNET